MRCARLLWRWYTPAYHTSWRTTPCRRFTMAASGAGEVRALTFVDTHTHLDLTLKSMGRGSSEVGEMRENLYSRVMLNDVAVATIPRAKKKKTKKKAKAKAPDAAAGEEAAAAASSPHQDKKEWEIMHHQSVLSAASSDELVPATHVVSSCEACIHVCCDIGSFDVSEEYINQHAFVYGAFGIHPHNAKDYSDEIEQRIIRLMEHDKTVAWGEIGLDYHYNLSAPDVQREVFQRQLQHAVKCGKPIVVHTREAEEDTFEIMERVVPAEHRVHVHCFTSSPSFAKKLLEKWSNLYIGFTGVISFPSAEDVRTAAALVPMNRFVLETDAPLYGI